MEVNGIETTEEIRYDSLNLSPEIMGVLEKKGFQTATPVQGGCIPFLMEYKDVVAKAPTGTGKTFAFGIPVVEHTDPAGTDVTALILAPTRELAIQIRDDLRELSARKKGIQVVCLYGGQPIDKQINQLKKKPQIVVATPGRLMDHKKRRTLRLDKVETVILDEADRMLDMGFIDDVTKILDMVPNRKNLGLFSATISREVMDISWVYQRDPAEITVRPVNEDRPDIQQYRIELDSREEKVDVLMALLEGGNYERAIAFCNTKNMADRLAGMLSLNDISCKPIHGGIPQKARERTLKQFRAGQLRVLVATDVAARGLDIDDVDVVFNYDVPEEQEYYIHRIGRTGRAKRHGVAYTFVVTVTEAIQMDEIVKHQRYDVQTLRFDEDGCLMLVESEN
ncbi:MAG: DEAD/DEAH box helicase [Candidatus Onthomonas sp.]|nr:DEAD/DEAH box helicase [Candidatus Onthomonas sp.]